MIDPLQSFGERLGQWIREAIPPATAPDGWPPFPFAERAAELFQLQFQQVEVFRRLCERRGVRPSPAVALEEIPAVPVTAFAEFDVTSIAPPERTVVFHSSGTTGGLRSRHFHQRASLALYERSVAASFQHCALPDSGFTVQAVFVSLTPPPHQAPHSSLVHMAATVGRDFSHPVFCGEAGPAGAWELDAERARIALEGAVVEGRPVCLFGTAFSFVHLTDRLAQRNRAIPLPAGSRVMETGGYKGRMQELPKTELHRRLNDRLGIPGSHLLSEYGMCELSSPAYDGVVGRLAPTGQPRTFRFPPWARSLVVSPETGRPVSDGETGLLRVVDLANVRSVLALQTEDLAVRRGDGFELLGRAPRSEPRGCSLMAG